MASPNPFLNSRLTPAPLPNREISNMSIVLLHGGGLSKEQLDSVPLSQERLRDVLSVGLPVY